jgi:hypothetical protein
MSEFFISWKTLAIIIIVSLVLGFVGGYRYCKNNAVCIERNSVFDILK